MQTLVTLELWKMLVIVGGSAIPLTFLAYWLLGSLMRIPATLREFWGKFTPHRSTSN